MIDEDEQDEAEAPFFQVDVASNLPPMRPAPGTKPLWKGNRVFLQAIRTPENMHWHGVYSVDQSDEKKKSITHICESPFQVTALVFDQDSGEQAVEISFIPSGGKDWVTQVWDKASLITGRIDSFCWKKLVGAGVNISSGQLVKLQEYIRFASDILAQTGEIPKRPGTSRTGWVGNEYVAAGWETPAAPVFIGQVDPSAGAWEMAGDREIYLRTLKMLVEQNPMFEFVAGYYLSGFLLSRLGGAENMVLCLLGDSTLGKTFAAKAAISMKGRPSGYATFDSTEGALKSLMQQNNDGTLVVDEVGTSAMSAEQRAKWIYDISSGKERARLKRSGSDFNAQASQTFRYQVLITGEESLLARPTADGQRVRYTEIVFNRNGRRLWDSITSGAQADEYLEFFEKNHGWLVPAAIIRVRKDLERYRDCYRDMLDTLNAEEPNAKVRRKHKLLAAAVTGTMLLHDTLGIRGEEDRVLGTVLSLIEHVDRDMPDAANDADHYLTALQTTVVSLRRHLYLDIDRQAVGAPPTYEEPALRPVLGKYSISVDAVGREQHAFILAHAMAHDWAKMVGVDLQRFLDWAERETILTIYPRKSGAPRRANSFMVGDGKIYGYRFAFESADTQTQEENEP